MKQDPIALRNQAAEPAMQRIRADRARVCDALKRTLEVIERRLFDHDFDVNALWSETGLNKDSSALFSSQLGTTPGSYISARRFEVAAELLAGTDLKLYQIGMALGYSVASDSFPRAFRHRFNISPTAYRKAVRSGHAGASDYLSRAARGAVSKMADQAGWTSAADSVDETCRTLSQAAAAARDQKLQGLAAELGLACHERGALRTRDGDVDRAYDDLTLARGCYAVAGELPPAIQRRRRHVAVSPDTDEALLSALCPDCRTRLADAEGRTVRHELRLALRLIPRDLEWFEVCCDDCYRVVWSAIARARAGLMDDAWKAWWLSANADLEDRETPPSRGRIIAALTEIERLVFGNQLERKGYADLALADALAFGDPLLEAQARIWRANALRAIGELTDARAELRMTAETICTSPWLSALQYRMQGILERHTNRWHESIEQYRVAKSFYLGLDRHVCGLLLIEQAISHFYLAEYAESVARNQEALSFLDGRRDPLPETCIVPINLAGYYALLGDWASAESALTRCSYDREKHPYLAAKEIFTCACLELLHGRARESARFFDEVQNRFESLHRPLDVAVAAFYSVEAHARLGNRARAVESAAVAVSFLQAAGCTQNTLEAPMELRALLEVEEIELMAIAVSARRLALRNGGWLPEPAAH